MGDSEVLPGDEEQDILFEAEPDWKQRWTGMPDYSHEDLQPWQTVLVHFKSQADRESFAQLIGQRLHAKTKFVWHPKAKIGTAADKVYTSKEKFVPRYPVYILSKGRADTRLTVKALEWIGVPYHICVEPQEYEQYAAVIDPANIFKLPFSNLGQGGIPARNWIWDHAQSIGAERHWILDDNISGFCRFQDNLKVELDNASTFCAIEDFVDRYENVDLAAFNYDYFAPRKQGAKIRPFTLNTRTYSGILIRTDARDERGEQIRWRGRYNEDTDLSLRILKTGRCTVLFNAFLMYKTPTLTMKGGNADALYAGSGAVEADWQAHVAECPTCAQCADGYDSRITPCVVGRGILSKDGRWLMAESLREQHPDCTMVERKWGSGQDGIKRWQHQVDYRRFQQNELILKADYVPPSTDRYQLELATMPASERAGLEAQGLPPSDRRKSSRQAGDEPGQALKSSPVSALDFLKLGPKVEQKGLKVEPSAVPTDRPPDANLNEPDDRASATTFAIDLKARGHRLLTRDGKFFVSEAGRLSQADRDAIKLHRAALVAMAEPWTDAPVAAVAPLQPEGRQEDVDVRTAPEGSIPSPAPNVTWQVAEGDAAEVSRPSVHDAERSSFSVSLFEPPYEPVPSQTIAQFLGSSVSLATDPNWRPDEPPDLTGVNEIVLNFATSGFHWHRGDRPIGITVSTMDGGLCRFLPFAFKGGGNLDEEVVKRWAREQLRGKKIINSKVKFDVHHAREWGVDLEEQGCTFSDIGHTAALLDDHRKQVGIDVLAKDYLPTLPMVARVDESHHSDYHASEVARRERFTAELVWRLCDAMYPELDKQGLREVQKIEDDVIPAVVEMEKNGQPIDVALMEQYHTECLRKHDALLMDIADKVGFAFGHTAKDWQRLFEKLGLPPTDGNDEATIGRIDHPTVKKAHLAAQYASLDSKTFSAYKENIDANGVLRFELNQMMSDKGGTRSGRFSAGYIQQVPNHDNHSAVFGEELFPRRLFVAANSGDYLEADAAQIEFRLLAHYAKNERILQAYRDDPTISFHKLTWAMLKQHKPDMLYVNVKSFNFAHQYGARSIKLAVMMGFITEDEGTEIRKAKRWNDPRLDVIHQIEEAYKRMVPEGDYLLDMASHLAKPECDEYCKRSDDLHRQYPHKGYVKTLCGRRSRFPTNYKTYIGLNRVLQGSGADIMKVKLAELHARRKETGFVMRLTVHDAVCGDATRPETKQMVNEILNCQSFPQLRVPILWEVGTGRNWAECK